VTRKTRLSALATAFGLTLTLGLALPIMAVEKTSYYTEHNCKFEYHVERSSTRVISYTWTKDNPDWGCHSGKNVQSQLGYAFYPPTYWIYRPIVIDYWVATVNWQVDDAFLARSRGKGLWEDGYDGKWTLWSPFISA